MTRRTARRIRITTYVGLSVLPAIIPFSCGQPILRLVTPALLGGGNSALVGLIKLVAPLVVP